MNNIICGDSLEVLKTLDNESIDCCITSPPYWGLRDYGVEGQFGLEKTPEEYVDKMVEVFREVKRVLKKEGTCWLNLGDTYYNFRGYTDYSTKQTISNNEAHKMNCASGERNSKQDNLKGKDLVGIPWMTALALRADGWYLRQDIIWHKPNPMPESVTDRCTKSHEYIFLLAKSQKYYFDNEAIKEPANYDGRKDTTHKGSKKDPLGYCVGNPNTLSMHGEHERWNKNKDGEYVRNKRSVWTITTKPFKEAHFATFPEDLIKPCVLAGCPEQGTILDPFSGAGTTGVVTKKNNRNFIGIELNPKYVEMAERRINNTMGTSF